METVTATPAGWTRSATTGTFRHAETGATVYPFFATFRVARINSATGRSVADPATYRDLDAAKAAAVALPLPA